LWGGTEGLFGLLFSRVESNGRRRKCGFWCVLVVANKAVSLRRG
jgi:hypothetical protein